MSLFSSLILFYPGRPPMIKLRDAQHFCDRVRESLSLRDIYLTVEIKYGKSIDQDIETTNKIEWDENSGTGLCVDYDWDHSKRGAPWSELWPAAAVDSHKLYRAYVCLGGLPDSASHELTAMRDGQTTYEFIAPDQVSLTIDPVLPSTLGSTELAAYGYIQLSFAGNGFFTWQPLADYWRQVRNSAVLGSVRELCREFFPVPRLDYLDEISNDLGDLFLNRDEYQEGDWFVSVSETG